MNSVLLILSGIAIVALGIAQLHLFLRVEKDWCSDCRKETPVSEMRLRGWRCRDCWEKAERKVRG